MRHLIPVAAVATVATVLVATGAYAFWSSSGGGSGTGSTANAAPLTVAAGTATSQLYPGGTAGVALTVTNPNPFSGRVVRFALDTSQGTGGYAADAEHAGCGLGALTFTAQNNTGAGWTVPAKVGAVNGALAIDLADSVRMAVDAGAACAGATIRVYLTTEADLQAALMRSSGLVSHWSMGAEPASADNFTGTAGTDLAAHTSDSAAAWSKVDGGSATLTGEDVRRAGTGYSWYDSSTPPASASYAVEADLTKLTASGTDAIGLTGRHQGAEDGSYYLARYRDSAGRWELFRVTAGTATQLGAGASQSLAVGTTYRLRLDLTSTTVRLLVDDEVLITAHDTAIAAAGSAGIQLGLPAGGEAPTDTTGWHLDNFRIVANTGTTARDDAGVNTGAFAGGPLVNVPGVLAANLSTAVRLNGAGSYLQVAQPSGLPAGDAARTVELWFRTRATGRQALFSYGSLTAAGQFGAWLEHGTGVTVWGYGPGNDTAFTATDSLADGDWHHLAITYADSTLTVYADGVSLTPVTDRKVTLNTVVDPAHGLGIGAFLPTGDPDSGRYFDGTLDDVAIHDVALDADTVADHHRLGQAS